AVVIGPAVRNARCLGDPQRFAGSDIEHAGKLPTAEDAADHVLAVSQPREVVDDRARDTMADLADQRRVVGVEQGVEEVLCIVVPRTGTAVTDRAVEVANQVTALLGPAFRQGGVYRQIEPTE